MVCRLRLIDLPSDDFAAEDIGAGAGLDVVGLHDGAAVVGPVVLELQDELLEVTKLLVK